MSSLNSSVVNMTYAVKDDEHVHICEKCGRDYAHVHNKGFEQHAQRPNQCPYEDCVWYFGDNNPTNSRTVLTFKEEPMEVDENVEKYGVVEEFLEVNQKSSIVMLSPRATEALLQPEKGIPYQLMAKLKVHYGLAEKEITITHELPGRDAQPFNLSIINSIAKSLSDQKIQLGEFLKQLKNCKVKNQEENIKIFNQLKSCYDKVKHRREIHVLPFTSFKDKTSKMAAAPYTQEQLIEATRHNFFDGIHELMHKFDHERRPFTKHEAKDSYETFQMLSTLVVKFMIERNLPHFDAHNLVIENFVRNFENNVTDALAMDCTSVALFNLYFRHRGFYKNNKTVQNYRDICKQLGNLEKATLANKLVCLLSGSFVEPFNIQNSSNDPFVCLMSMVMREKYFKNQIYNSELFAGNSLELDALNVHEAARELLMFGLGKKNFKDVEWSSYTRKVLHNLDNRPFVPSLSCGFLTHKPDYPIINLMHLRALLNPEVSLDQLNEISYSLENDPWVETMNLLNYRGRIVSSHGVNLLFLCCTDCDQIVTFQTLRSTYLCLRSKCQCVCKVDDSILSRMPEWPQFRDRSLDHRINAAVNQQLASNATTKFLAYGVDYNFAFKIVEYLNSQILLGRYVTKVKGPWDNSLKLINSYNVCNNDMFCKELHKLHDVTDPSLTYPVCKKFNKEYAVEMPLCLLYEIRQCNGEDDVSTVDDAEEQYYIYPLNLNGRRPQFEGGKICWKVQKIPEKLPPWYTDQHPSDKDAARWEVLCARKMLAGFYSANTDERKKVVNSIAEYIAKCGIDYFRPSDGYGAWNLYGEGKIPMPVFVYLLLFNLRSAEQFEFPEYLMYLQEKFRILSFKEEDPDLFKWLSAMRKFIMKHKMEVTSEEAMETLFEDFKDYRVTTGPFEEKVIATVQPAPPVSVTAVMKREGVQIDLDASTSNNVRDMVQEAKKELVDHTKQQITEQVEKVGEEATAQVSSTFDIIGTFIQSFLTGKADPQARTFGESVWADVKEKLLTMEALSTYTLYKNAREKNNIFNWFVFARHMCKESFSCLIQKFLEACDVSWITNKDKSVGKVKEMLAQANEAANEEEISEKSFTGVLKNLATNVLQSIGEHPWVATAIVVALFCYVTSRTVSSVAPLKSQIGNLGGLILGALTSINLLGRALSAGETIKRFVVKFCDGFYKLVTGCERPGSDEALNEELSALMAIMSMLGTIDYNFMIPKNNLEKNNAAIFKIIHWANSLRPRLVSTGKNLMVFEQAYRKMIENFAKILHQQCASRPTNEALFVMLAGESRTGKSALACKWIEYHNDMYPNNRVNATPISVVDEYMTGNNLDSQCWFIDDIGSMGSPALMSTLLTMHSRFGAVISGAAIENKGNPSFCKVALMTTNSEGEYPDLTNPEAMIARIDVPIRCRPRAGCEHIVKLAPNCNTFDPEALKATFGEWDENRKVWIKKVDAVEDGKPVIQLVQKTQQYDFCPHIEYDIPIAAKFIKNLRSERRDEDLMMFVPSDFTLISPDQYQTLRAKYQEQIVNRKMIDKEFEALKKIVTTAKPCRGLYSNEVLAIISRTYNLRHTNPTAADVLGTHLRTLVGSTVQPQLYSVMHAAAVVNKQWLLETEFEEFENVGKQVSRRGVSPELARKLKDLKDHDHNKFKAYMEMIKLHVYMHFGTMPRTSKAEWKNYVGNLQVNIWGNVDTLNMISAQIESNRNNVYAHDSAKSSEYVKVMKNISDLFNEGIYSTETGANLKVLKRLSKEDGEISEKSSKASSKLSDYDTQDWETKRNRSNRYVDSDLIFPSIDDRHSVYQEDSNGVIFFVHEELVRHFIVETIDNDIYFDFSPIHKNGKSILPREDWVHTPGFVDAIRAYARCQVLCEGADIAMIKDVQKRRGNFNAKVKKIRKPETPPFKTFVTRYRNCVEECARRSMDFIYRICEKFVMLRTVMIEVMVTVVVVTTFYLFSVIIASLMIKPEIQEKTWNPNHNTVKKLNALPTSHGEIALKNFDPRMKVPPLTPAKSTEKDVIYNHVEQEIRKLDEFSALHDPNFYNPDDSNVSMELYSKQINLSNRLCHIVECTTGFKPPSYCHGTFITNNVIMTCAHCHAKAGMHVIIERMHDSCKMLVKKRRDHTGGDKRQDIAFLMVEPLNNSAGFYYKSNVKEFLPQEKLNSVDMSVWGLDSCSVTFERPKPGRSTVPLIYTHKTMSKPCTGNFVYNSQGQSSFNIAMARGHVYEGASGSPVLLNERVHERNIRKITVVHPIIGMTVAGGKIGSGDVSFIVPVSRERVEEAIKFFNNGEIRVEPLAVPLIREMNYSPCAVNVSGSQCHPEDCKDEEGVLEPAISDIAPSALVHGIVHKEDATGIKIESEYVASPIKEEIFEFYQDEGLILKEDLPFPSICDGKKKLVNDEGERVSVLNHALTRFQKGCPTFDNLELGNDLFSQMMVARFDCCMEPRFLTVDEAIHGIPPHLPKMNTATSPGWPYVKMSKLSGKKDVFYWDEDGNFHKGRFYQEVVNEAQILVENWRRGILTDNVETMCPKSETVPFRKLWRTRTVFIPSVAYTIACRMVMGSGLYNFMACVDPLYPIAAGVNMLGPYGTALLLEHTKGEFAYHCCLDIKNYDANQSTQLTCDFVNVLDKVNEKIGLDEDLSIELAKAQEMAMLSSINAKILFGKYIYLKNRGLSSGVPPTMCGNSVNNAASIFQAISEWWLRTFKRIMSLENFTKHFILHVLGDDIFLSWTETIKNCGFNTRVVSDFLNGLGLEVTSGTDKHKEIPDSITIYDVNFLSMTPLLYHNIPTWQLKPQSLCSMLSWVKTGEVSYSEQFRDNVTTALIEMVPHQLFKKLYTVIARCSSKLGFPLESKRYYEEAKFLLFNEAFGGSIVGSGGVVKE